MKKLFLILFAFSFLQIHSQELINSINCAEAGNQSVVSIRTFNSLNQLIGKGSGVLISNDGKIVTNYHVFEGGKTMIVNHQGRTYQMKSILYKSTTDDILIFSIGNISSDNNFKPIKLGSVSNIVKGERIYAIGNTYGQYENDSRITNGIISTTPKDMIEFTAPVNRGNSGGALVNDNCELIGIVTAKDRKTETIGYAIPIDRIKNAILKSENGNNYFYVEKEDNSPYQFNNPQTESYKGSFMLYLGKPDNSKLFTFIDNKYYGSFDKYLNNPICGEQGTLTIKLPVGIHNVKLYYDINKSKLATSFPVNIKETNTCYANAIIIKTVKKYVYSKPIKNQKSKFFYRKSKLKHNVRNGYKNGMLLTIDFDIINSKNNNNLLKLEILYKNKIIYTLKKHFEVKSNSSEIYGLPFYIPYIDLNLPDNKSILTFRLRPANKNGYYGVYNVFKETLYLK